MKTKDVLDYFNNLPEYPAVIRHHKRRGPMIGAVRKTANAIGCTVQNVYSWGDEVPENVSYKIHVISGGKIPL